MPRTARCPSCGAPVLFRSAASILAVCEFCQSTLVREGEALRDLGRMAALIEDQSPIQRGSEGRWHSLHFAVVGRIQLRYEAGIWSEWHLLLDDGSSAWLSESAGEYVFTRPDAASAALPPFDRLEINTPISLAGAQYRVTNLLRASCVAGEGELPFLVGGGYPAPVADLRDERGGFASLDYSEDPLHPLVFVGQSLAFDDISWSNLRQTPAVPEITEQASAFACPACAAPLTVSDRDILSVGCGACGAVIDTSNQRMAVIAQANLQLNQVPRLIALGSTGTLRGQKVTVVGFLRRRVTGASMLDAWHEYLLLDAQRRPIWLVESHGHWNLGRVLPGQLNARGQAVFHDHQRFVQYDRYQASVEFVVGEFPWRVSFKETVEVVDYVKVPLLLSSESTAQEVTWTLSEYIASDEIALAFRLARPLPVPRGVYANQPNPHVEAHGVVVERFGQFCVLALLVQVVLLFMHPRHALLQASVHFDAHNAEAQITEPFALPHGMARLEVAQDTTVDNGWIDVDLALINQDTSETWQATREFSEYHGIEDGEYWSENGRSHVFSFRNLPAGHYALAVEHDMAPDSRPVDMSLSVQRPAPRWSMLLLVWLTLGAFPLFTLWRRRAFEEERQAGRSRPDSLTSFGKAKA